MKFKVACDFSEQVSVFNTQSVSTIEWCGSRKEYFAIFVHWDAGEWIQFTMVKPILHKR